jgi:hypothetical protein
VPEDVPPKTNHGKQLPDLLRANFQSWEHCCPDGRERKPACLHGAERALIRNCQTSGAQGEDAASQHYEVESLTICTAMSNHRPFPSSLASCPFPLSMSGTCHLRDCHLVINTPQMGTLTTGQPLCTVATHWCVISLGTDGRSLFLELSVMVPFFISSYLGAEFPDNWVNQLPRL